MAKFKVFAVQSVSYVTEIEASTANEAEEIYWDMDELGEEIDGSASVKVDEIQLDGELVENYNTVYPSSKED